MSDEDGQYDHMEEGNAIDGDNNADANEDQDEFENIVLDIKNSNVWTESGLRKNKTLRELIKCFGCMVKATPKPYSIPDHNGRYRPDDMSYEKLLDASKYVTKAKRELLQNENFDTRDFTIFIANKQWIKNILRPLFELCAKDDSMLAMRCCSLALVLVRRLSDESQKTIKQLSSKTRKASSQDLQANEEEKDLQDKDIVGNGNGKESVAKSVTDASAQSLVAAAAVAQRKAINVQQQLSALLSFKEALCSDKCNEAISNAFKEYWLKEQVVTSEDHKTIVAICFAYLRRILAIEPISPWSSPGEMLLHRSLHDKYILQLRLLLSVIPGICSDLMNSYHNDWLGDVILIIYFVLKGFEVKELYRVWSTGALIQDFGRLDMNTDSTVKLEGGSAYNGDGDGDGDGDDTYGSSSTNKENAIKANIVLPAVILPDRLVISNRSDTVMAKGQLSKLLQKERTNRQLVGKSALPSSMGSRFKGVFQKNLSIPTSAPSIQSIPLTSGVRSANQPQPATNTHGDTSSILGIKQSVKQASSSSSSSPSEPLVAVTKCIPRNAVIIHNPFNESEANIPQQQPQAKRSRRNLAFTTEKGIVSKANEAQYILGEEHQKAAVVVASLINLLSNELSLKPLVKRVNEDLRRDDLRVGPELELRYFEVLSKVLQYHRMKLMEEQRRLMEQQSQGSFKGGSIEKMVWKPNLKNVMDALDRMSFTRVVVAIERIGKSIISIDDVVVPLCLYKEMVCYLRILLESGLEGHHEIAIAALWRLFYASSERLDPLPKLLSGWKAGTYSRAHLVTLVELVHETLKTLEAAHTRFAPLGADGGSGSSGGGGDALKKKKKDKKKKGRHEMDLDQYVMGCMRFKVDDYVRKIASNQTIRMYTKLLSHYKMNDPNTNHHIYCFLKRMCAFVLEQDWKSHDSEWKGTRPVSSQLVPDEASLGFMLFNISTLDVFSDFLNDPDVPQTKELEPLVRLVKAIVRRFGEALKKNRMLFVELLFQHSRPHEHCCSIDSVYDAAAHAAYLRSGGSMHHQQQHSSSIHDDDRSPYTSDGSISDAVAPVDYGDEFDENDFSVRPSSSNRSSNQKEGGKGKHSSSRSGKKQRHHHSSSSSTHDGSHDDDDDRDDNDDNHVSKVKRVSSRRGSRRSAWTKEEDDVLTEQYACYAGTFSVFTSIAQHPALIALGNNRSEAQISKRVRYLNLHMKMADRDDDYEEKKDKRNGVVEDGDEPLNHHHHHHHHASTVGSVQAILDPTVSSSDANGTQAANGSQRSSSSSSGWDNDDYEDPRKVALFKNSVLSRLNMDDYDNDDDDAAAAAVIDQSDRGGAKMVKAKVMKEVSAKMKKKKGLIGRRLQSKVRGIGGSDYEDSDQSFDDDNDDSAMVVVQVPDNAVLQAGFNKKRQLVIDSDDDE